MSDELTAEALAQAAEAEEARESETPSPEQIDGGALAPFPAATPEPENETNPIGGAEAPAGAPALDDAGRPAPADGNGTNPIGDTEPENSALPSDPAPDSETSPTPDPADIADPSSAARTENETNPIGGAEPESSALPSDSVPDSGTSPTPEPAPDSPADPSSAARTEGETNPIGGAEPESSALPSDPAPDSGTSPTPEPAPDSPADPTLAARSEDETNPIGGAEPESSSDSLPDNDTTPTPDPAPADIADPSPAPAPENETNPLGQAEEAYVDRFVVVAADADDTERARLKAVIEAVIYITDEPLALQQIAQATARPLEEVKAILDELTSDYARPERGLSIRELAGGYKMATKPEHHEEIRAFVKNLKPPLKLSLAALETLAVIAYKQPITAPEIMEIRGVQGAGVLKTLLDRKLIATAGRKNVIGKPILYKTTREFLVQFGLKDLSELPTLKEFEELGRFALSDSESVPAEPAAPTVHEPGHLPVEHAQDPESTPVEASAVDEPEASAEEPGRDSPGAGGSDAPDEPGREAPMTDEAEASAEEPGRQSPAVGESAEESDRESVSAGESDAPAEEPGRESPPIEEPGQEPPPVEPPEEEPPPVEDPRPEPEPLREPPPPPDQPEPPMKVESDEPNA